MNRNGQNIPGSTFGGFSTGKAPEWKNRDDWILELQVQRLRAHQEEQRRRPGILTRSIGANLTVAKR